MLAASWLKEVLGTSFNFYLLGVVLFILATGVVVSMIVGRRHMRRADFMSESVEHRRLSPAEHGFRRLGKR